MKGRTAPIKAMLLDQRRRAGVGNIYADEALFAAGIHPLKGAGSLTPAQAEKLRETGIAPLRAGERSRGAGHWGPLGAEDPQDGRRRPGALRVRELPAEAAG